MDIHAQLKNFGLNHSEISVYLFLLENGISTPPNVSRGTNIARTNCYNILTDLKNKDLISEQGVGKRKAYVANDPEALLRSIDKKKESIERILPDLRGLLTTQKHKPKIKYFDGIEQVKQIYMASLEAEKVFGFTSMSQFMVIMGSFGTEYLHELARRKVFFDDILTESSRHIGAPEMKEILGPYYTCRFMPPEYKILETDIMIWGNNVALLTLTEPVFGTILTSKSLAATFKTMHSLMWKSTVG